MQAFMDLRLEQYKKWFAIAYWCYFVFNRKGYVNTAIITITLKYLL